MALLVLAFVPFVVVAMLYSSPLFIHIVSSHDEPQIVNPDFVGVAIAGLRPNRTAVHAG